MRGRNQCQCWGPGLSASHAAVLNVCWVFGFFHLSLSQCLRALLAVCEFLNG